MSNRIDPSEATVSEDFDALMGQLVKVDAAGESFTLKAFGPKVTVVVDFHPDWVIEAVERDERFEVRKLTEEDVRRAQHAALGIEEPTEDEDDGQGGDA